MTKTILVTNLEEINHIKVSCAKCGFAAILPLDIVHILTVACVKCGSQFPTEKIKTWLEATSALKKDLSTTSFADAVIEIETEEEKT